MTTHTKFRIAVWLAASLSLLAVFVTLSVALMACHGGLGKDMEGNLPTPIAVATPARSPVAVEIPPITDALVTDARSYAKDTGVDLDEAVRRLGLQRMIGKLGAAVRENESATYGGHWIRHEPEYGVVFAFTRDGEDTIRQYVHGTILADMVEVRQVEATLLDLKTAQQEAMATLEKFGLGADSGIDVKGNVVELYMLQEDRDELDDVLQESGLELPDRVKIEVVTSLAKPM